MMWGIANDVCASWTETTIWETPKKLLDVEEHEHHPKSKNEPLYDAGIDGLDTYHYAFRQQQLKISIQDWEKAFCIKPEDNMRRRRPYCTVPRHIQCTMQSVGNWVCIEVWLYKGEEVMLVKWTLARETSISNFNVTCLIGQATSFQYIDVIIRVKRDRPAPIWRANPAVLSCITYSITPGKWNEQTVSCKITSTHCTYWTKAWRDSKRRTQE